MSPRLLASLKQSQDRLLLREKQIGRLLATMGNKPCTILRNGKQKLFFRFSFYCRSAH